MYRTLRRSGMMGGYWCAHMHVIARSVAQLIYYWQMQSPRFIVYEVIYLFCSCIAGQVRPSSATDQK